MSSLIYLAAFLSVFTIQRNAFQGQLGCIKTFVSGPQYTNLIPVWNFTFDPSDTVPFVICAGKHLDVLPFY